LLAVVVTAVTAATLVIWSAATPSPPPPPSSDRPPPRSTPVAPPEPLERLAEPTTPPSGTEPAPAPAPAPARELVAAAEGVANPGMTFGVAVLDVDTGDLVVGRGGTRQFMSASLCKLIVAVDVLDQHRAKGLSVDPTDLDLITRALSGSDDNAMSALWGRHDGAGAIGRVATRLTLTGTAAPEDTAMWGDTTTTAADMTKIYRHVLRDMAQQDSAVIVKALVTASPVATDGFAQNYGLLHQGASADVYAKQAWVEWGPAGYLLHSAGVAYDRDTNRAYAIALLTTQPNTPEQTARDHLSKIAAAALAPLAT